MDFNNANTHLLIQNAKPQFSTKKEDLVAIGIIDPPNLYKFIFFRLFYLLTHPQKWLRWLKTIYLDLRYSHAYLGGRVNNGCAINGRTGTSSSSYDDLTTLFSHITIENNDVLVDVGCGKGRVLNYILSCKLKNSLFGIEVDATIGNRAKKTFQYYSNVTIQIGSIEEPGILPIAGSIFYLCNPFSDIVLKNFATQLEKRILLGNYKNNKRPLIVYNYCYFLNVFEESSFWEVKKIDGKFAAIIIPRLRV